MDFAMAPGPVFGDAFPDSRATDGYQFQAYFLKRIGLVGDVAVPVAAGRVLVGGKLFSRSFKLAPATSKIDTLFIPFSLFVESPGLLHLSLDVAFYKGWDTYKALADADSRLNQWLAQVNVGTLMNAIGADAFKVLTGGKVDQPILAEVEVPPAWLVDP